MDGDSRKRSQAMSLVAGLLDRGWDERGHDDHGRNAHGHEERGRDRRDAHSRDAAGDDERRDNAASGSTATRSAGAALRRAMDECGRNGLHYLSLLLHWLQKGKFGSSGSKSGGGERGAASASACGDALVKSNRGYFCKSSL